MGDEDLAAGGLAGGGNGDNADCGAVVLKRDLGFAHEADRGTYIGRNGDLTLRGDAHRDHNSSKATPEFKLMSEMPLLKRKAAIHLLRPNKP